MLLLDMRRLVAFLCPLVVLLRCGLVLFCVLGLMLLWLHLGGIYASDTSLFLPLILRPQVSISSLCLISRVIFFPSRFAVLQCVRFVSCRFYNERTRCFRPEVRPASFYVPPPAPRRRRGLRDVTRRSSYGRGRVSSDRSAASDLLALAVVSPATWVSSNCPTASVPASGVAMTYSDRSPAGAVPGSPSVVPVLPDMDVPSGGACRQRVRPFSTSPALAPHRHRGMQEVTSVSAARSAGSGVPARRRQAGSLSRGRGRGHGHRGSGQSDVRQFSSLPVVYPGVPTSLDVAAATPGLLEMDVLSREIWLGKRPVDDEFDGTIGSFFSSFCSLNFSS
nr:uncharacterized protein LOC127344562 [Lolium perenne]